jgi:hypothetical protein
MLTKSAIGDHDGMDVATVAKRESYAASCRRRSCRRSHVVDNGAHHLGDDDVGRRGNFVGSTSNRSSKP